MDIVIYTKLWILGLNQALDILTEHSDIDNNEKTLYNKMI